MRRTFTSNLAFLTFALVGCAHAKTTETVQPTAPEEPLVTERAPPKVPAARTKGKPERVTTPLAADPLGLLNPGAEQQIHDKLSAGGFMKDNPNGPTQAALRRFQAEHDLPATGAADHETIRRLGLNPDDLFRKAP